ncbi:DNA primase [Yersinia phage phi80-18]|uniref:DNA primase/helicase n=1 Tax=Yersinia phage phi80-18 TaxID=1206559 RepID=I7LHC6_9CAUD|nr:DNA primase [Yersinia phage phi80-18]CCI88854.2 DNA primase/helicase [Yersinia phage phi80-18]
MGCGLCSTVFTKEALMTKVIEKRLWLPQAKGLLHGDDTKIIHKGCGTRASLFIKNDADRWWCFCHRCRGQGYELKVQQRIKMKLDSKTGWMPEKLIPITEAIISEPYNFRELFSRYELAQYVTLLQYSTDTKRVYLPDESGSYLGLDCTMQANARFYSPFKRNLAVFHSDTGSDLYITGSVTDYLASVHTDKSAILIMNRLAEKAALAVVATTYEAYTEIRVGSYLRDDFMKNVRPFL